MVLLLLCFLLLMTVELLTPSPSHKCVPLLGPDLGHNVTALRETRRSSDSEAKASLLMAETPVVLAALGTWLQGADSVHP